MKKGVYIIYNKITDTTGVNKKIHGQIEAFKKAGFEMKTVHMSTKYMPGWKILYRLPFTNILPHWRWFEEFENCDFIYFRRPPFMNVPFLGMLKVIRKRNPNVKIIMEIPTYPYDREFIQIKRNIPLMIKDKIEGGGVKRYIDAIAVLTEDKEIFKIPAVRIRNGFDFSDIRLSKILESYADIHIAACALFQEWHGYERLINGLHQYYQNGGGRRIVLHFIGEGPELNTYKKLVKKYGLQSHAVFYGRKRWSEIMEIYDRCSLGASSLGVYKAGLDYLCALKLREYLAAGLPIIGAGRLDVMEVDALKPYVCCFANNSSVLPVEQVICFHDSLYLGKKAAQIRNMMQTIQDETEKNFNMDSAMKNVVNEIQAG